MLNFIAQQYQAMYKMTGLLLQQLNFLKTSLFKFQRVEERVPDDIVHQGYYSYFRRHLPLSPPKNHNRIHCKIFY